MANCKDCIHEIVCSALIEKGLPWNDGEYPAEAFCMTFVNKADVVPKSEVERLQKQVLDLNEHNAQLALKLFKDFPTEKELEIYEVYEKTKYSVAREIFEEIERNAINSNFSYIAINKKTLSELKKKYTEGEVK